ncbi:MAG: hypothetical protein HOY79_01935 [Streptomyces sp.]|nr:hypothetical protein [Streptomyces sp.]
MTIQAIDTYYAGHYFRSRLEARWATVFNDLGLRWEYEPQGYLVGERRRPYLPDFYLTDLGWWIEVKGHAERLDVSLLVDAIHPTHGIGRTDPWHRTNILILGPIPAYGYTVPAHFSISRSAVLGRGPLACGNGCPYTSPLFGLHHFTPTADLPRADDQLTARRINALLVPSCRPTTHAPDHDFTEAIPLLDVDPLPHLEAAYLLGRTARFEHGAAA